MSFFKFFPVDIHFFLLQQSTSLPLCFGILQHTNFPLQCICFNTTEIQLLAQVDELEILQAKCDMTEDPSPLGCYAASVGKQFKIILLDHQDEAKINPPQLQQLFIYSATPHYKLNLWHTTLLYDMIKVSG